LILKYTKIFSTIESYDKFMCNQRIYYPVDKKGNAFEFVVYLWTDKLYNIF